MFKPIMFMAVLTAALPVWAETAVSVNPANVLSAITLDFNEDGTMDRAVLVRNEGEQALGADLLLFIGNADNDSMALALKKTDTVWAGSMWGTLPSLDTNEKGSLLVKSGNAAIGRNRWERSDTVVYRNNEFIWAGSTSISHDTLDPDAGVNCDVNLLTGKGVKNKKAFTSAMKAPKLAELKEWSVPECDSP